MSPYLRTGLLFFACLLLFVIPEPAVLRNRVLDGLLIAVLILLPLHLIFTRKEYRDPQPAISYWIIGLAGSVLTGIFWFRIATGSYGFETGLSIEITKTLFFWAPAALFALLYRSAGEGWIPGKRSVILTRLLAAVAGSLIGITAGELARSQIDSLPMTDALIHVEQHLPEGNSQLHFSREGSALHLDVILDPTFTEPNIRTLQRLRAIADQSARLTRRKDTDSVSLRVHRNNTELASLRWPGTEGDLATRRLRINYSGTGLSSLPLPEDLELLFGTVQEIFRPKNLEAALEESVLHLRWIKGAESEEETLRDPLKIPDIIHDWRAASHAAIHSSALFEGLELIRLHMPGHSVSVAVSEKTLDGTFRFQRQLPVPEAAATIQIFDSEEMPRLPDARGGAPVLILWGDGEFDTRPNRVGPLWPWEKGILAGYEFHITGLDADGTVDFVIHPAGRPDDARALRLKPGQQKQLDSVYLRNVE